ncbi:MAG: 2-amino-4-hydroxy-6-hydroxymethyldihydropteridine diphosphokinase [Deltaproteobacteria bacterium]|nr:2-amino-4-hydroxy-6-hydroxymethyldihydropteridine diphosphokinase [Deltaproteobacteria bacterium]MBW2363271.1 2-amino-4-hydroxy-6-hydroxymethyldihydropteridine diphosphokinase [Deltaproteobacteria bacterium]
MTAYVALGSNLGDRAAHLDAGVAGLAATAGVRLLRRARFCETRPVGGPLQGPYLNGAVSLATTLPAAALLARLHAIEAAAGRTRGAERNTPRTLDLDLLLYGDAVIECAGLRVPHPRLHERSFVLDPLCDIAPELVHPVLGVSIQELARRVRLGAVAIPSGGSVDRGEPSWPS